MNNDDLAADKAIRADGGEGVFADVLPHFCFYVHFDLNLGDSCKPDFFDSADLNSGEPDVVPGGESFYVFECRTKRYAFYKGFLLATQDRTSTRLNSSH